MDNYIPDVPEQTTGSIAKKPRATKTVKSTMYHSEEFKERYEYFLQMRFEKKQKNTEFEQKMILEKLHKAGNENEALEMLTNAILGGHTNVVPINNGKTLQNCQKSMQKAHMTDSNENEMTDLKENEMTINGNMKKAVLKEGNEKNKNEKDIKNQKLKMILMIIFHFKRSYLYEE